MPRYPRARGHNTNGPLKSPMPRAKSKKALTHRKPGRPKGARNKKPNPKYLQAIEMIDNLVDEGKPIILKDIAQAVGLHREALSRAVYREDIAARFAAKARQKLGGVAMLRAASRMNSLIDAQSENLQFEASRHVLAIAGIKPRDSNSSGAGRVSVVFNLSHAQPGLVNVTPAMQIEQVKARDDGTE